MRHRAKARLVALAAALALMLAASDAAGEDLRVSSSTFRNTWAALTFEGALGVIRCPVTLEGSFHATLIAKEEGNLIGYVTRATSGVCASGGMTVLSATLPWHVTYTSFTGTLPNITSVNLATVGAGISIREPAFGITCLGTSTAERPVTLNVARAAEGTLTTATAGGAIPTSCGVEGRVSGSGTPTVLGSSTRIRLELVEAEARLAADLVVDPTTVRIGEREQREVTLTRERRRPGRITINDIEVVVRGENFTIADTNRCRGNILSAHRLRECRFIVRAERAGVRNRQVQITYRRGLGAEQSRTIVAES